MGTGTEDYYNCSWAPVVPFATPFGGAPRADEASSHGYNTFVRTRNLDVIPFGQRLQFDLEMLSWNPGAVSYTHLGMHQNTIVMTIVPSIQKTHVDVYKRQGENLVQRFVIYENRIIAFVGQLLAVDNDLHVKRAFELPGYIREPRIDERQVTVVYAVGERPAGEPHRRDAPRPFVDLDHVARSRCV